MPDRSSNKKRPRDTNLLAKSIVDAATDEQPKEEPEDTGKNPAAVALGRLGGKKAGKARAEKLTLSDGAKIAKKAADKRWAKE